MLKISLDELAKKMGYEYHGNKEVYFGRVVLDSREVSEGDLFVAVKGEKTDGHLYIEDVLNKGAAGIVSVNNPGYANKKANLIVADGLFEFFARLGKETLELSDCEVLAITGSVGKTSTKDILNSVLREKYNVIRTEGNNNNEVGLPLTISRIDENTEYLILEMGMRGLGQIEYLADIATPKYGIITNIEPVHQELLGSLENIAKAKSELGHSLPEDGVLIINHKDKEVLGPFLGNVKSEIKSVGFSAEADYNISEYEVFSEKKSAFVVNGEKMEINASGKHNVYNATLVFALLNEMGLMDETTKAAFKKIEFSSMRFSIKEMNGVKVINDAYNANPKSMISGIDNLNYIENKRKILVLGDMYELGDYEKRGHEEVADAIVEENIDLVITLGELGKLIYDRLETLGFKNEFRAFFETEELVAYLKPLIKEGDLIFIKGSRGMRMETIAFSLEEFLNDK